MLLDLLHCYSTYLWLSCYCVWAGLVLNKKSSDANYTLYMCDYSVVRHPLHCTDEAETALLLSAGADMTDLNDLHELSPCRSHPVLTNAISNFPPSPSPFLLFRFSPPPLVEKNVPQLNYYIPFLTCPHSREFVVSSTPDINSWGTLMIFRHKSLIECVIVHSTNSATTYMYMYPCS